MSLINSQALHAGKVLISIKRQLQVELHRNISETHCQALRCIHRKAKFLQPRRPTSRERIDLKHVNKVMECVYNSTVNCAHSLPGTLDELGVPRLPYDPGSDLLGISKRKFERK